MKKIQRVFRFLLLILILVVAAVYCTVRNQSCKIYTKISEVPSAPVAIVFGAGIGTRILSDRVATAVSLYKYGKVQKILMTGDNGHLDYDEPMAMKSLAVAAGVPKEDVVCDYAGFRTYDSLYRAHDIFDVHEAILVTQGFHLPRALYIAKNLGLSVIGIKVGLPSCGLEKWWYELREVAACEFAWLDVVTQRKPRFLGKKESLFAAHDV